MPATNTDSDVKPKIKQEYIAKKGDTITGISSKIYGTRDKRAIDAIVAANPKELKDANSLRAERSS